MLRSFRLVLAVLVLALAAAGSASAYPWPVKPFNKQHPIRGFFGDPRTVFENGVLAGGFDGPGFFSFHQGIDISAPDGTPIYPVVSGTAHYLGAATLNVNAGNDVVFQYFHVVPIVGEGEQVIAKQTILGYVQPPFGHVHLTEINGIHSVNPLQKGHLTPYVDRTKPVIRDVLFQNQAGVVQTGLGICGRVALAVDAFDTPPLAVPGKFGGFRSRRRSSAGRSHGSAAPSSNRGRRQSTFARRCPATATSTTSTRKGPTRTRRASAPSSTPRCPAAICSCFRRTTTRHSSGTASTS